ncbi:hypothetical protein G6F40_015020 [Rhizopus arrhizus]|nr:hypothetical protein G6F40_015020 [Rhizopus arrhizus]
MNRKLTLLLPLAMMAACSQPPAPAGTGGDAVAPAAAKAADQQTLAHLDAQRLQSQHWLLQQATGADGKRIDALFAREDKPLPPGRRQADRGRDGVDDDGLHRQGADGAGRGRVEPPAGRAEGRAGGRRHADPDHRQGRRIGVQPGTDR